MENVDNTEKFNIVTAFVREIINVTNAERCLEISIANFCVFSSAGISFQNASGFGWENGIRDTDRFDFILANLPLGMSNKEYLFGSQKLKIRQNWIEILKSLQFISDNGAGLYLVEPTCFGSSDGERFEEILNSGGSFVRGIFSAPEGILLPETSITPVFVLIQKKEPSSVFIAELLEVSQSVQVARNCYCDTDSHDLSKGMKIEKRSFYGFHRIRIKNQIDKLETQYKEYEEYSIKEIAIEINYVSHGKILEEKTNSVYIPKVGNSPVVATLSETTTKHHNYFQVVLGEKAINEYVAAFYKSNLGKLILQSLTSGTIIQHLNKSDLELAPIALPSISDQEQIITTNRKLRELKDAIDIFHSELALNPTSSSTILMQLDSMLESIGGLSEADAIRSLIRQGESKTIEFKETLSLDVKKQTKEKYIELSALKTIVAFLNTEGGVLLIGISDDGQIPGLSAEIEKFHQGSTDKFLLHFKNLLKTRVGEEFYPYIEYKLTRMSTSTVLSVKCKESKSPCYLDNAEFYVRTNPATDKLEGPKLVQYVKNHFVE